MGQARNDIFLIRLERPTTPHFFVTRPRPPIRHPTSFVTSRSARELLWVLSTRRERPLSYSYCSYQTLTPNMGVMLRKCGHIQLRRGATYEQVSLACTAPMYLFLGWSRRNVLHTDLWRCTHGCEESSDRLGCVQREEHHEYAAQRQQQRVEEQRSATCLQG